MGGLGGEKKLTKQRETNSLGSGRPCRGKRCQAHLHHIDWGGYIGIRKNKKVKVMIPSLIEFDGRKGGTQISFCGTQLSPTIIPGGRLGEEACREKKKKQQSRNPSAM